ncbi:MAG: histidine ammonia-lyase [Polyangiaceae bacterium]
MPDLQGSSPPLPIGLPITVADLVAVARQGRQVTLAPEARARVAASRAAIEEIAQAGDAGPAVYGINTGFGALAETRISHADIAKLQKNLVRSHACGVGPDLRDEQVVGMMLLRAQVVAQGHSGVREEVVDLLLGMINARVCPRIPSQGSVGASGDLAPLAHLALGLIGEGQARYHGELMPAADALAAAGLAPLELKAKEGIALINGTQYMTAIGALALADALTLCTVADIATSMSVEALKGSKVPFDERLMAVRPHPGQGQVAANMRALLAHESSLMASHAHCGKVQDPYSLRCVPQVHGATRDALAWAAETIGRELNSVTDNPTVFLSERGSQVISGGNFHGQPIALALDLAAIATAELANISERRVEQLVNPALSTGLTPFLAPNSGLCSGFMIAQVASASLVSENKVLCHPASVDSIPSSANREDHVSMGSISAKKLDQVVENVAHSLAIELIVAAQGLEQRLPLTPAPAVKAALAAVRDRVPTLDDDRPLYTDFAAMRAAIADGSLVEKVTAVAGALA